jgi:uncharacterized membrane protein YdjX (TVP38/TMEM64 family)
LNDLSRRLGERGLLAIVFARVVPVGPFSVVNIVAGASHIGWRDFLLGTVIGLLPGVTVASIFVDRWPRRSGSQALDVCASRRPWAQSSSRSSS